MYFSRISLNPQVDIQQLTRSVFRNPYQEHQRIWRFFESDPDAKRDFLYRRTGQGRQIKYYLLSERQPFDNSGVWRIEPPKHYDPKLRVGQRLAFSLLANPVVTLKNSNGTQSRHDVVMHEKRRIAFKDMDETIRPPLQALVRETGIRWLAARGEDNGFTFDPPQVMVDGYRRHQAVGKRVKSIRYSSIEFQGALTVTEPERFKQLLFNGIGKAKAFGCGLMLIRKVAY